MFYSYGGGELLGKTREDEQNVYGKYPLFRIFCDFSSCMYMSRWYQEYGWIIIEGDILQGKREIFFVDLNKITQYI